VRERTSGGGGQRAADGLLELIDEAIAATRALTADLSSPVLYELGLEAALRSLCDRTAATLGLTVRFTVVGEARALPEGADVVLFRAARELVHNAVKHAHASRVEVELRWTADGVSLRVGDDGLGFREQDPASGATPRGFGLLSLRQQVRALGGAMDVESTPGAGTAVEVRVSC
jgi:signal transduction histidine kinase